MASRYMHTIDGKPACFNGEQIVYAHDGIPLHHVLVIDLKQIRREQRRSIRFRESHGWDANGYSYIRFTTEKK